MSSNSISLGEHYSKMQELSGIAYMQERLVNERRGGRFGIAVSSDEHSLLWQELEVERLGLLGEFTQQALAQETLERCKGETK